MDYLTVIVSAFCSIVAALGGGLIHYRQTRRMKEVEVESKQSDEWKKLYEESDEECREKDKKIDDLYSERQEIYKELIERDRIIACKDIRIERLKFARCDVNGCLRDYESDIIDKENEKDSPAV